MTKKKKINFHYVSSNNFIAPYNAFSEVYSRLCQTPVMEQFAKIVNAEAVVQRYSQKRCSKYMH